MATKNNTTYTVIGYGSLLMWSLGAVFTAFLKVIPIFEILSIVFSISFLVMATKLTYCKQWHFIKQRGIIWIIGILGIYGNDFLFVAAFKYAPPMQVDLINYLWPILVILFSFLLPNESFKFKYLIAAIIGFFGVSLLLIHSGKTSGISAQYWIGYMLAFLEALVWAAYTLFSRYYGQTPSEMIGMYCGVGALFSIPSHFFLEPTVIPTLHQGCLLLLMGLTTQGAAYLLWDLGVKRGNFKVLSILSYGNPILSVFFLLIVGLATVNMWVIISCLLVTAGGFVSSVNWPGVKKTDVATQELNNDQQRA